MARNHPLPVRIYPQLGRVQGKRDDVGSGELTFGAIALVHVIAALGLLGYAQNYYFHLRKSCSKSGVVAGMKLTVFPGHHKNHAH